MTGSVELDELIEDICSGPVSRFDALRLAHLCCKLQRTQDHGAYSGNCHEPIDASPLIVEDP